MTDSDWPSGFVFQLVVARVIEPGQMLAHYGITTQCIPVCYFGSSLQDGRKSWLE
jgi:hypothetical protein